MAGSVQTSSSSILSSVNSIQSAVQAARDRVVTQNSGEQAENSPEVQAFSKEVRKSPYHNNRGAATDIGILARNVHRLNVVSNLKAKDPSDFYKFRVTSPGEAALGQIGDEGIRVQLMTKLGVVMADSDEKSGKLHDSFKQLQAGELSLKPGEYVLRVTREPGAEKKDMNYALQLQMGKYTKDFDTIAREPQASDSYPQLSVGTQNLQSMLNTSVGYIQNLPPIGTSATAKLLGAIFNTSI